MSLYLISYDLHAERHYGMLYELMAEWQAKRLLQSVFLAELRGPAEAIRDIVRTTLDGDDAVAVIELEPTAEWATIHTEAGGTQWLWDHIPFRA